MNYEEFNLRLYNKHYIYVTFRLLNLYKVYNLLHVAEKPEGKGPLGRPRNRWMDNIRMDLQDLGCGYVDWIGLAQDRNGWRTLVRAVMNLRVP